MSSLPLPSSSWLVGRGGVVVEVRSGRKLLRRQVDRLNGRRRVRCGACGREGHNARNKKLCLAAMV